MLICKCLIAGVCQNQPPANKPTKSENNMKTNIYLTNEQKQHFLKLKKANQVSYSTITETICGCYYVIDQLRELMKSDINYKTNEKYYKTSVNLKNIWNLTPKQINQAIQMFFAKVEKNIPNQDNLYSKTRNKINRILQNTYDEFYNYNTYIRMRERYKNANKTRVCQNEI